MHIPDAPFETTEWSQIPAVEHPGVTGVARWRTRQLGAIRVRMVEYSAGYVANHWCEKGHVVLCLEGSLKTELADGRTVVLSPGMTYQVGDGTTPHRSSAPDGARLFIVD